MQPEQASVASTGKPKWCCKLIWGYYLLVLHKIMILSPLSCSCFFSAWVPESIPYCLCKLKSLVHTFFFLFKLFREQVQMAFMNWAKWNALFQPAETKVFKNGTTVLCCTYNSTGKCFPPFMMKTAISVSLSEFGLFTALRKSCH